MGPIGYNTGWARRGTATYGEICGPNGHLANGREFNGHSMWAQYRPTDKHMYDVYSYSTRIAVWDQHDNTVYLNPEKYSVTTSKHQSKVRAWLGYAKAAQKA